MTVEFAQDLRSVRDYYTRPRDCKGTTQTIYQIWESGGAFDDSVTPSTYCPEYQRHIFLKLQSISDGLGPVFSIGCGNAIIEAMLAQQGRTVRAIDCNEEAVALACSKRVDASVADIMQMPVNALSDVSVLYADGLVGHLFDPVTGLGHFFNKIVDLGIKKGSYILISNDAPRSRYASYEQHARVKDFWYVSPEFLAKSLEDAGFRNLESYTFPYVRPKSGLRHRTICLAKA